MLGPGEGLADIFATIDAPNVCWGSQMQGSSLFCAPGFRVGQAHFKNKVCAF